MRVIILPLLGIRTTGGFAASGADGGTSASFFLSTSAIGLTVH